MNARSAFLLAAGAAVVAALALTLAAVAAVRAGDDPAPEAGQATDTTEHATGTGMSGMEHGAGAPQEDVPNAAAARGGQPLAHTTDGDTWVFKLTAKAVKWEILPGVRVGAVDVSGLEPTVAAERLRAAYASLAEGELVLVGPNGPRSVSYAELGRRPDVEAMVAEAMAIGRDGNPLERVVADARTAIRGATVTPRVTFDPDALSVALAAFAPLVADLEGRTVFALPTVLGFA